MVTRSTFDANALVPGSLTGLSVTVSNAFHRVDQRIILQAGLPPVFDGVIQVEGAVTIQVQSPKGAYPVRGTAVDQDGARSPIEYFFQPIGIGNAQRCCCHRDRNVAHPESLDECPFVESNATPHFFLTT